MTLRHTFSHIQHSIDQASHVFQFYAFQVVFGNTYISLDNFSVRSILPCSQPHVFLFGIGSVYNQFSGSLSVYGIVHFILDFLEKQPCCRSITVIINGSGINIREFLVKAAFTQPYLPDFGKQMFKIVFANE